MDKRCGIYNSLDVIDVIDLNYNSLDLSSLRLGWILGNGNTLAKLADTHLSKQTWPESPAFFLPAHQPLSFRSKSINI